MGPTTCEEEVVEQRVEVDDSCSEQDEKQMVVRVDWEDNNNIVGAWADEHGTEQDDDEMIGKRSAGWKD